MAARVFPCGHQISRARARLGRCQQAHHQFIAFESFDMAFSLAANDPARNRIRRGRKGRLTMGCGLLTRRNIVSLFTDKKKNQLSGKKLPSRA
jgi:hypothetical protein